MQHHQMKCAYISEVCKHHECVHCISLKVAHATYHIFNIRFNGFPLFGIEYLSCSP